MCDCVIGIVIVIVIVMCDCNVEFQSVQLWCAVKSRYE